MRELVDRYFALAADPDLEAYHAQFSRDAVVEDDGQRHVGIDAVRAWRTAVPSVTYSVRRVGPTPDGQEAIADIAGDFPGSPVRLEFTFRFDGDAIRHLTIRPHDPASR
ncbi:nuclear transport factor 2 family protein [Pseudonocardia endophytica]|uniref:SnoaL-like protein n=1 Tax=Pseudonocardia endophytica TaxID=401976 RepID=A0A4R1HL14_PSEEN|nr:nuclear transport factor 2 family protein [Pseudonocardia endophytica]TCK21771.1 SnoaL-like protein [Pseudonocardia endophytica]